MAESNEQPPLCPCGFWGSVQTSGLCSVCYKERQQQNRERDAKLFGSGNASSSALTSAACQVSDIGDDHDKTDDAESEVPDAVNLTQSSNDGAASEASDSCRQEEPGDCSTPTAGGSSSTSRDSSPSRPTQKNRRRCFSCKARLELAFLDIGRCKCGYTFCELHRLPEQHACTYDHKENGRQEAREKMVSPKKHVGTSLKRLDS